MGAIPDSKLPGLRQLDDRAKAALDRCQESQDIEFKESAPWDTLKWKIIRTALGMSNLRDGGIIIIGVSERDRKWNLDGIKDEDLSTYDPDGVIDKVNAHAAPSIEMTIATVNHNEKKYLCMQIREFKEIPVICMRNGQDDEGIQKGTIYIRPIGKPQTSQINDSNQMRDLMNLAAEKNARQIIEQGIRIGMKLPTEVKLEKTDEEKFIEDLNSHE